jgi:peptidoglycan-N-acetylglucosamine deacetylase
MKRLTFTFDNGPWGVETDRLLDFLKERRIKSTFFVVGQQLTDEAGLERIRRAHREGHWIANHTYTHGTPLGLDGGPEVVEREIAQTQKTLGSLAHPRKFFRPNGAGSVGPHLLSRDAVNHLMSNDYTVVLWNSAPGDWLAPHEAWFGRALDDVDRLDWTVLVLHDKHIGTMLGLLADFHDEMLRRGIEIVQDFPDDLLPISAGRATMSLDHISTQASPAE